MSLLQVHWHLKINLFSHGKSGKRTILKVRVLVGEIWTQLKILGFLPKKVIQVYNEHVNCYKLLESKTKF